jgi:hypothetical protein
MGSSIAFVVAGLALAGALASWAAGVYFYVLTMHAMSSEPEQRRIIWLAFVAWPFLLRRLQGSAVAYAHNVNKALVAFLACLMVAAAAISVATNLSRVAR